MIRLKINLNEATMAYSAIGTNIKTAIVYWVPSPWVTETAALTSPLSLSSITLMNHGNPSDSKMANELAPNELAMPVPAWPRRAIIAPVIISGVQPPIASTVRPNTDSGMEKVWPATWKKVSILFTRSWANFECSMIYQWWPTSKRSNRPQHRSIECKIQMWRDKIGDKSLDSAM